MFVKIVQCTLKAEEGMSINKTNSNLVSENNYWPDNGLTIKGPIEEHTSFKCFICGAEQKCSMCSLVLPICNECVETLKELVNDKKQKMREYNAKTE